MDKQLEKTLNRSTKMDIESNKLPARDYSHLSKKIEGFSNKMGFDMKVYIYNNSETHIIREKYEIISELKESTFSHVYLVKNIKTDKLFCVKKIKDDKNFLDQSLSEIYVLDYLRKTGDPTKHKFVDLHEFFYFNVGLSATLVHCN